MRILSVDDNEMNRRVLRLMLESAALEVVEAANAETGLRLHAQGEFDMILMDLRMPGMDGLDAIRAIRARADAKANIPIVVLTADAGAEIRDLCTAAGADDLLTKPVEMSALFDCLGRALSRAGSGEAVLV